MESQLRVLTRDLDENKTMKPNQATMVAIDPAEIYIRGTFPSLGPVQQSQLAYQVSPGSFQPTDLPDYSNFKPITLGATDQNQSGFLLPKQQQQLRQSNIAYPQPMLNPITSQNIFSNPVSHPYTLKTRNLNPTHQSQEIPGVAFNAPFRNSLAPSMIQKQGFLPQATYTNALHGMNPVVNHTNLNYTRPPIYDSKLQPFSTSTNPFGYGANYNQMVTAQAKANIHGGNRYSQSTGGKGRRQHIPARRKGAQGTVSAGSPFKFTFGDERRLPSTSTPIDKQEHTLQDSSSQGQILTFSSTREGKPNPRLRKPPTPETVFDVEAEDRYWDALSTKPHTTR